jgi:hypothetical protein
MLTFEVASFDIGYNCILERPFLLKFMAIVHTAYATIKMPSPKGVITIKSDQRDALECENAALSQGGRFRAHTVEEQAAKMANTLGGNTQSKSLASKPPTGDMPPPPSVKKGTHVASGSNQPPTDHQADDKKEATDKEVLADPSDPYKKLCVSANLEAK